MITSDILKNRIENFWGYGSLESLVWFIGMEEGFRSSGNRKADMKMLEKQFLLPTTDGMFDASRPIASEFSDLTNLSPFLSNSKIQRTWEFPITLYLFLKNRRKPNIKEILDFQHFVLADGTKKEAATLELSPLPSPNTNSWFYSDIPGFELRKSEHAYLKYRSQKLRDLVRNYSPRLVIFYSANRKTHLPRWAEVIGKIPDKITYQMYFAKTEKTSFCIIPQNHHNSMTPARLYEYAEKIKDLIQN